MKKYLFLLLIGTFISFESVLADDVFVSQVIFDKQMILDDIFITPKLYVSSEVEYKDEYMLVTCVYKNDVLQEVYYDDISIQMGSNIIYSSKIHMEEYSEDYALKSFLWSKSNIMPIHKVAEHKNFDGAVPVSKITVTNGSVSYETKNLTDNNVTTTAAHEPPYEIIMELHENTEITGVYAAPTRAKYCKKYEIYTSTDGVDYTLVKEGSLEHMGYRVNGEGYALYFRPQNAKYVKFKALTSIATDAHFSEMRVLKNAGNNSYISQTEDGHNSRLLELHEKYKLQAEAAVADTEFDKIVFVGANKYLTKNGLCYWDGNNIHKRPYTEGGILYTPTESGYESHDGIYLYNDEIAVLGGGEINQDVLYAINEYFNPIKKAADVLNSAISLKNVAKTAHEHYINKQYYSALTEYRRILMNQLRSIDLFKQIHFAGTANEYKAMAQYLMNDITPEEYKNITGSNAPIYADPNIISKEGTPIDIDWTKPNDGGGVSSYYGLDFLNNTIYAYLVTDDQRYVNKYFQLADHFFKNQKEQTDGLSPLDQLKVVEGWTVSNMKAMNRSRMVENALLNLSRLAKYDGVESYPNGGEYYQLYYSLNKRTTSANDNRLNNIPADTLAYIIASLVNEYQATLLTDAENNFITNQQYDIYDALNYLNVLIKEKTHQQEAERYFQRDLSKFYKNYINPDGGMLEQSFNYNIDMLEEINTSVDLTVETKTSDFFLENEAVRNRMINMFLSIVKPVGTLPRVGNYVSYGYIPEFWENPNLIVWKMNITNELNKISGKSGVNNKLLSQIKQTLLDDDKENTPKFTSITFPYSGYTSLRNGWDRDSSQLFMLTAKPAEGHRISGYNGIELTAFGRKMLVFGGPPWYNTDMAPVDFRDDYEEYQTYFDEKSGYKANSIIVDGGSQLAQNMKRVCDGIINGDKFFTNKDFDYTEGLWQWGYALKNGERIDNITHRRQVYYLREENLWIVDDTLNNSDDKSHEYSQIWGFSPQMPNENGYSDSEILCSDNKIVTKDNSGANLALYTYSSSDFTHNKYYGFKGKNQYIGWYAHAIAGERLPKVDVHVNMTGVSNSISKLLTVITPYKDDNPIVEENDISSDDISGFNVTTNKNVAITYKTSAEKVLEVGNIKVNGDTLLCVEKENVIKAIVTNCREFYVDDIKFSRLSGNFIVTISRGEVIAVEEIKAPTDFEWENVGDDITPNYSYN